METKSNPLLRKLILYQILAIIAGVGVLSLTVLTMTRVNYNEELASLHQKVQNSLTDQQEKWRTWKQLHLDDALKEEFTSESELFPIKSIDVIHSASLPKHLEPEQIVLPQDLQGTRDESWVLFAQIDTTKIQAAYFPYRSNLYLLIGAGIFFIFITLISAQYIYRNIHGPISQLNNEFDSLNDGNEFKVDHIESTGEIRRFINSVKKMHEQVKEHEGKVALAKIADQVVHDIRSPLSVIDSTVSIMQFIPEDKRILMNTSISRIKGILKTIDIQNQLPMEDISESTPAPEVLLEATQSIVSAKRVEYRKRLGLEIEEVYQGIDFGFFSNIHKIGFDSVISNLINNSVDAIDDIGKVAVSFTSKPGHGVLKVSDSGKGIAPEDLPKLMQRGVTIGKKDGRGFGLYHAKTTIESWGGKLAIESALGLGTTVTITLPRTDSPRWFMKDINLPFENSLVVIFDDDPTIHEIWTARFRSSCLPVRLLHFYHPNELRKWHNENPDLSENAFFLNDLEIRNAKESGLDMIEEMGTAARALLVTSRSWDENVRARCERLGAKMIPKNYAGFIPITSREIITGRAYLATNGALVQERGLT